MIWKEINKKVKNFGVRGAIRFGILLAVSLLATNPLLAQDVTIEGKVVLESVQKSTVETNFSGYQNVPRKSSVGSDSLSNDVVVWLVAKDKSISGGVNNPDEHQVLDQMDKHFNPRLMVVKVGDVIRIQNSDPVYHNVFSLSKTKRFDVGRRSPGDHQDVKFDKAGKVDVFCDIHSDMHAVIIVAPEQTVATQRLNSGDFFRFRDIPQGEYVLHLYALGDWSKQIDIQADDAKKITLETIRLGS